ncbi:NAD(P)/FAD-dependent oxidoreductase [Luteimonas aquatica]|uniref:NAD(P)/FAD-dependent oxidoreductase n=1 Tax=Luteimonas aquatica TaxID=450364 RepID=UPI001F56C92D|nr:FAD/NAD(P)-binding oxidoreductase [Luteimonas aquatica]
MREPRLRYDVLVVGAGPAGLAAAHAAAASGARVGVVDAQPRGGGQVWRHDLERGVPAAARRALRVLDTLGVTWMPQVQVTMAQPGWLLADCREGPRQLHYRALVLATGARELLLPFPGWTLPGVTGAGGAQALSKLGWPLRGKRVVVAGSGPLLLASAATLRAHGAQVLGIHEQASAHALRAFALRLPRWPGKAAQALALRTRLLGVRYRTDSIVVAAHGDDAVREVEIESPHGRRRIACDQLAVGYGLVANTELAQLLGCRLEHEGRHPRVAVDPMLRTSVHGVFAAGEALGIGGRDCALVEGAMAGYMAVGAEAMAERLRRRRRRARAFAEQLRSAFALRPAVHAAAREDVLVCRCEDVPLGAVLGMANAREAKLASRCGMGACQGRVCGTALAELGLARAERFSDGRRRPPLFPVRLDALAGSFLHDPRDIPS